MIKKAFIQQTGNKKLRKEERLVVEELEKRGIPIIFFMTKQMARRQLRLDLESLVVGDIDCVEGALHQLEIPIPDENTYPHSLKNFLYRKIWKSNIENLASFLINNPGRAVFAKPASRKKKFTGQVFETENDFYFLSKMSKKIEIFCSEVVSWKSEYRIYVVNSKIRAINKYEGEPHRLDMEQVQKAIQILATSGEATAGYAIDFGVLETGETALIERNDGYSLGAYEIDSKNYTELLLARWEEIISPKKSKTNPT